jgi:hypothetical protein
MVDLSCQATMLGFATSQLCDAEDAKLSQIKANSDLPSDRVPVVVPLDGKVATAIAVGADDHIFVAIDRSVMVLDREGRTVERLQLDRVPRGLAIDSTGTLYVAHAKSILAIDCPTKERRRWQLPNDNAWLSGIATLGDDLYVADSKAGIVWRFDRSGTVKGEVASKFGRFSVADEFFSLSASAGELHIANPRRHQVESFDASGQSLATWGSASRQLAGFSGCCNPMAVAVRSDGCVVTAERGIPRVKLFSASGEFKSLIAGPEDFSAVRNPDPTDAVAACNNSDLAVAVDSRHRTLVLDQAARHIRIFG